MTSSETGKYCPMGETSSLYSDCLPSTEPTLPKLRLSPGALSSKDPVSSQNCNQFISLPTTFAVPYSPYQSFAEIPFFPPPAQEMQSAPSSNQGQYNQAVQVGFFDQREQYSSLGPNCPVRLPYGASILPEPVPSGRIVSK